MYNKLKLIATDNSWVFKYARRDFANLLSQAEGNNTYLFLDPVQTSTDFDDYGNAEGQTFTGSFMLLKSSKLDEGYEERYLTDIKPLIDSQLKLVEESFACSDYIIESWTTTEIVNLFDYNFNGVVVKYLVSKSN